MRHHAGSDERAVIDRIIVIGGGGHGKVVISVLKKAGASVVGYVDAVDKGDVLGISWLGTDEDLPALQDQDRRIVVAIGVGKVDAGPTRRQLLARIESMDICLMRVISPQAVLNEQVTIGAGTVVLDGAVLGSGVVVGRGCIVNSNSTVEHDCELGDDVHVGPGAVLSGGVTVGDGAFIGAGASVVHAVRLAGGCLIGAGATVTRDISEPGTYVGTPARLLPAQKVPGP